MTDLFFSYNTTNDVLNETKVQFLAYSDFWKVSVNNEVLPYMVIRCESEEDVWYELNHNTDFIKSFDFEKGGLSYLPNLIQVYQHIVEHSIQKSKKDLEVSK